MPGLLSMLIVPIDVQCIQLAPLRMEEEQVDCLQSSVSIDSRP
jgi:hypothetical protein